MITPRTISLVYFETGLSASAALAAIHARFGKDAISKRTVLRYFSLLRKGATSLDDKPRSGRPQSKKREDILALVRSQPNISIRKVCLEIGCAKKTVSRTLKAANLKSKTTKWLPHNLTLPQQKKRVTIAKKLLHRQSYAPFVSKLVTGDEKWILVDNTSVERVWVLPGETIFKGKPPPHQKKYLLCCFWNKHGIVHFELLERGNTVNAALYCDQLRKMKENLVARFPQITPSSRVTLLHDNARPHVAKLTKQTAKELNVEFLPHPPYSPDLAPSDFHLFRSLEHTLRQKIFDSREDIRECLLNYFREKKVDFWRRGLEALPERWERVVASNGAYFKV